MSDRCGDVADIDGDVVEAVGEVNGEVEGFGVAHAVNGEVVGAEDEIGEEPGTAPDVDGGAGGVHGAGGLFGPAVTEAGGVEGFGGDPGEAFAEGRVGGAHVELEEGKVLSGGCGGGDGESCGCGESDATERSLMQLAASV